MRVRCAPVVVLAGLLSSCGGAERLVASFTSRVVQFETCKTVTGRDEQCAPQETIADLRVHLVEVGDDTLWLSGIPRDGGTDRAILGTRDSAGGFLFVDERTTRNSVTGCELIERVQMSLSFDPDADGTQIGSDACIALVGREIDETSSSTGCDVTNTPPVAVTRVDRKRWQALPEGDCTP